MRLLIVDDGFYIVEYLKHLLDWTKYGVDHIETTTNSIEAKAILDQGQTDILITDIRMPEVSGLDLLEHVNKHMLRTKVIILSGYSQFDYAQSAIRLGALDYLLKPVDKEDMEKAMQSVVKHIGETPPDKEELDGPGYLLSVISEQQSPVHSVSHADPSLNTLSFCFFQVPDGGGQAEITLRDNSEGLEDFIWQTPSGLAGLVLTSRMGSLQDKMEHIHFSQSFELGKKNTVRHHFYSFFHHEDMDASDFARWKDWNLPSKFDATQWELVRRNMLKKFAQLTVRKHKLLYLLEFVHFLYRESNFLQSAEVADLLFYQLSEPDAALKSILLSISEWNKNADCANHQIVHTIQTYIADHISEGLSLEDLGKIAHLHPVYLSKLYKQETGENLSAYISMKRLEKASQLLIDSSLHVVDISRLVGYKKNQYFIKLFKDQYGVTPYQYRRQHIK
ncbi:response regulator [Paenibacillus sp. HW567]|uniref:response regulator n=1 Tax=Paenibacillus sp. HW567 TaxID=1034769 RepID=UPI000365A7A4|nr:response regulator [Paenibacillus sp. HW567]